MGIQPSFFRKGQIIFAPILTLFAVGAYLFSPEFALFTNGLGEMLYTGGVRGVMMYYYSLGDQSPLAGAMASALVTVVPVFKAMYLWTANVSYFGSGEGVVLSIAGTLLGALYLYSWGQWLAVPIKGTPFVQALLKLRRWLFGTAVLILTASLLFWPGALALATGLYAGVASKSASK